MSSRARVVLRPPAFVSARWFAPAVAALVSLCFFAVYAILAVERQRQMLTTGYDLGIFEQEVRSYAAFHWPISTIKGPDYPLLGDHFSPIVALTAPFYWIYPHTETLLVVQAGLFASSIVPLALWARRVLGWGPAIVVSGAYGLSWGIAYAVEFDFHEIAYAMPMLAWSLAALGQGRYRTALLWAAPLVLVKEDLGFTLAALAGVVAWRSWRLEEPEGRRIRTRTWALMTIALGVIGSVIAFKVVLPSLNAAGHDAYSGQLHATLLQHITGFFVPELKLKTLVMLLAPTAFLALRSPLALIAVPTIVWRFASDNPTYWGHHWHYSAVLMPILFAAFIEGLTHLRRLRPVFLLGSALVTIFLFTSSPLHQLGSDSLWAAKPKVAATRELLDRIPSGATVAATNSIVPQLTSRTDVSLVGSTPLSQSNPEYIIADEVAGNYPISGKQVVAWVDAAEDRGYRQIAAADGIVLLKR